MPVVDKQKGPLDSTITFLQLTEDDWNEARETGNSLLRTAIDKRKGMKYLYSAGDFMLHLKTATVKHGIFAYNIPKTEEVLKAFHTGEEWDDAYAVVPLRLVAIPGETMVVIYPPGEVKYVVTSDEKTITAKYYVE